MRKKMLCWLLCGCLALCALAACSPDEATKSAGEALTLEVEESTGTMNISRPAPGGTVPDTSDEPSWTIYVYLCGSDLETYYGAATEDLTEMVAANGSDDVRLVVETGGCKRWKGGAISNTGLQRFVIQNGSINEVDNVESASMGESETLSDFLTWAVAEYPSEHMGVILWNHGGGSISGVCFDEQYDADSLSLREVETAFQSTFATMGSKFDFVGFDACLMATIETANVLASYADYQYGSEEVEPGGGWDYTAIVEYLAEHSDADAVELGTAVCESYQASYAGDDYESFVTFSVVDLSKIDELLVAFNDYANELYTVTEDEAQLGEVMRAVVSADNYGGNNRAEGYTNMVDLGGVIGAGASCTDTADVALGALEDAVVTHVEGRTHANASGLSIFYPLTARTYSDFTVFAEVCVSPYYLALVDRTEQMGAGNNAYDDSIWFSGDVWQWGGEEDSSYWDYVEEQEATGESGAITFAEEPYLDENGVYGFQLDENGINNATAVCAYVYELSSDGRDYIELGETADVYGNWDTGAFVDGFDGNWLSLPDGQNLATYIADRTDDYVVYTSPILLNDQETNLRMRQYADGSVVVEGAWTGVSESGAADREVTKLVKGDVIVPLYYAYDVGDGEESLYEGDAYKVRNSGETVDYAPLQGSEYEYCFCIDDIYGDYLMTDTTTFYVESDGSISFAA